MDRSLSEVLVEAAMTESFKLHGKTIQGSMGMGEVFALDFTDGTSLWMRIRHHGPQDGGRVSIVTELREEPL
jgi:hypothetical protein